MLQYAARRRGPRRSLILFATCFAIVAVALQGFLFERKRIARFEAAARIVTPSREFKTVDVELLDGSVAHFIVQATDVKRAEALLKVEASSLTVDEIDYGENPTQRKLNKAVGGHAWFNGATSPARRRA